MRDMRRLWWSLAVFVVTGCMGVPVTPGVDPAAAPDRNVGYVAGTFSVSGGSQFAFQVAAMKDGRESEDWHLLTFAGAKRGSVVQETKTQLIPLPPGEYRVRAWVTFYNAETRRKDLEASSPLGRPFVVKPGHVVYLGRFSANTDMSFTGNMVRTEWTIQPERITSDDVTRLVETAYPRFVRVPLECMLCSAPRRSTARHADPVIRPAGAKVFASPAKDEDEAEDDAEDEDEDDAGDDSGW